MTFSSFALLVDGDNVPGTLAGQILRKTADLGPARIRRVYCNQTGWAGWDEAPSFHRVQVPNSKDAADIQLSIEAMGYALTDGIETFAIVSCDRDLSLIAHRLREMGRLVVGLGLEKAPAPFRGACDHFHVLNAEPCSKKLDWLDKTVREFLQEKDPQNQGRPVKELHTLVQRKDSTFRISETTYRNWRGYLQNRPRLFVLGDDSHVHLTETAARAH